MVIRDDQDSIIKHIYIGIILTLTFSKLQTWWRRNDNKNYFREKKDTRKRSGRSGP